MEVCFDSLVTSSIWCPAAREPKLMNEIGVFWFAALFLGTVLTAGAAASLTTFWQDSCFERETDEECKRTRDWNRTGLRSLRDCNDKNWICHWGCRSLQRCAFGGPNFWDIISLKQTDKACYSDKNTPLNAQVDLSQISLEGVVRGGVLFSVSLLFIMSWVFHITNEERQFSLRGS